MGSSKKHKEKDRDGKKKKKHRRSSRSRSKERKRKNRDKSRSRSRSPIHSDERYITAADDYPPPGNNDFYDEYGEAIQREKQREFDRRSERAERSERERLERLDRERSDRPDRSERGKQQVFDYNHINNPESSTSQNESNQQGAAEASGDGSSLSIEETNRLRAKLGLKPLDVPDAKGAGGDDGKPKKSEGVHRPPVNLSEIKKTEKLKEKMENRKRQRELSSKLSRVKGLGESDSDDDGGASAWVQKSRKQQKERIMAEKRAKMLEEMDADFGIGGLVEQEFQAGARKNVYTSHDLSGIKVQHGLEKFSEGRNVILTLKDRGILDEDGDEDTLINVNIEDDERAEKNVENKKKKPDYKPYDEAELDEYGMMKPANLLEKYDEEIDGEKKESFTLGSHGVYDAAHEKRMVEIRRDLKARGESLLAPLPTLATEYMTQEEVKAAVKFNKTKKKVRKIRKKLKADDLVPLPDETTSSTDHGSRNRHRPSQEVKEEGEVDEEKPMEVGGHHMAVDEPAFSTDLTNLTNPHLLALKPEVKPELADDEFGPDEDLTGVDVEEEEARNDLQNMLAKARKLKLKKERKNVAESVRSAASNSSVANADGNITLNSTSEFCRNLGEIPTYGLAGNRDEDRDELLDMELELMEQKRKEAEQEEATGGWNEVDVDETPVDIQADGVVSIMEEEPIATDGIGAALALAQKKGFLEEQQPSKGGVLSAKCMEMLAQNYTIQDKRYDDLDEKNRKRERYSGGMVTEFSEKTSYKPEVKLDYVDDGGRSLCAKEAFRQLSHRFHGKGSGKKKTEKRSKKVEEELLMKRMSSTDTPLNTLSLLQDKQRTEQSPYIVLSGGSKGLTANSIVKN